MSLAKRMKQAKLERLAEQREEETQREEERAAAANTAPTPASLFNADPNAETAAIFDSGSVATRSRRMKLARIAVEQGSAVDFAPDRDPSGPAATEFELLMAALGEDMHRLKHIQSKEGKIAAKREMIDRYTPHVDATLAASEETGTAVQDELLVNMMVWRFDIGDFDRGLDIAAHVLRYGLRLPERYQRTSGTVIAEEVAQAALDANKVDKPFELPVLQRTEQLTADADMPDIVRAKVHKAMGQQLVRIATLADDQPDNAPAGGPHGARSHALKEFRRAAELDAKAGVVKEIERLESWLKKHPVASDTPDASAEPASQPED